MSDYKIIGIFTTKGGTGKTTLALNLATALKKYGKVLLVELDSNFTLTALLNSEATQVVDFVERNAMPTSKFGISLLSADGRISKYNDNPAPVIAQLMEIAPNFNYVVFDFHNAPTRLVAYLLKKTNLTIVPAVPTLAGMGAYLHTKKLLQNFKVEHLGVANMVHRSIFGIPKREREVIERMSDNRFSNTLIPYDKAVADSELLHAPVVVQFPKSPFAKAVEKLAMEVR